MIYLDNAATTKMFEEGADLYKKYACHSFFNPSAGYGQAVDIKKQLIEAKKSLLKKLGASKGDIIFTGGATESNNLAVFGSKRNGKYEYVFSISEHPSVYNVAKELERQGFIVHFVGLDKSGQIDYDQLEKVVNDKTRLISVEHVNNETGAVNDIKRIVSVRDKLAKNALVHVDGVQSFCKLDFVLDKLSIDFYSISAHKFHGPKGVGALYVKNLNNLKSIVFGGGQEEGYRSGTENIGGIMSMEYAFNKIDVSKSYDKVYQLNKTMTKALLEDEHIHINDFNGSPYILSVWFEDVNGETLMRALAEKGVIVGTGSACSTKKAGNRILENLGFKLEEIKSHIRISFCEELTIEEIEEAAKIIKEIYNQIRSKVL